MRASSSTIRMRSPAMTPPWYDPPHAATAREGRPTGPAPKLAPRPSVGARARYRTSRDARRRRGSEPAPSAPCVGSVLLRPTVRVGGARSRSIRPIRTAGPAVAGRHLVDGHAGFFGQLGAAGASGDRVPKLLVGHPQHLGEGGVARAERLARRCVAGRSWASPGRVVSATGSLITRLVPNPIADRIDGGIVCGLRVAKLRAGLVLGLRLGRVGGPAPAGRVVRGARALGEDRTRHEDEGGGGERAGDAGDAGHGRLLSSQSKGGLPFARPQGRAAFVNVGRTPGRSPPSRVTAACLSPASARPEAPESRSRDPDRRIARKPRDAAAPAARTSRQRRG